MGPASRSSVQRRGGGRQDVEHHVALGRDVGEVSHRRVEEAKLKVTLERYTAVCQMGRSSRRNSMCEGVEG